MSGRVQTANESGSVELLYNPHQDLFLQALNMKTPSGRKNAYSHLSLFSGRRGGKTKIGAIGSVEKMKNPAWWMWICAPTYPDLTDFVIPEVFANLPLAWIDDWSESRLELMLKNKTRVQFRSLDDPDKARGPGLNYAWVDECAKVVKLAYDTLMPALSDKDGQFVGTTTPKGYDWCYDELWVPAHVDPRPGYWACKYHTKDNPLYIHNPTLRQRLEDDRLRMDPVFYQQEYEAEFVSFTGAVYGPLLTQNMILRTDEDMRRVIPEWPRIDPSREVVGGLDPGAAHPFAGVLFVVTDKGLVQIGEYLERNRPMMDHFNGLTHEMCGRYSPASPFKPERWAIDRSQKQSAMELQLLGMPCVPANNDVIAGINRVKSWMRLKQIWFYEPACPKTIKQLQGYSWAENYKDTGETKGKEQVLKKADDLPDAVRYALMLYQEPSIIELSDYAITRLEQLAAMPEAHRWAIERNRRCEQLIYLTDSDNLQVYGDDSELTPYGEDSESVEGSGIGAHFYA
jgi:hypothetical protein